MRSMVLSTHPAALWLLLWHVVPSYAKIFPMKHTVLGPGQVHAEIHPIHGAGGKIEVDNLHFRLTSSPPGSTGYYYTDVALVQVDAGCLKVDDSACQWTKLGLGATTGAGDFSFCCTQELSSAGKCASLNRVIANDNRFSGLYHYVTLSPNDNYPQNISFPNKDKNQVGMYALLLFNCNVDAAVQVSGQVRWASYIKDNGPFDEGYGWLQWLASHLKILVRRCDVDMELFGFSRPSDDRGEEEEPAGLSPPSVREENLLDVFLWKKLKISTSHFKDAAKMCTAEQAVQLNKAFDDFKMCSGGWDLQAFIEDLPSGLLGTLIECAVTTDWEQISNWADIDEFMSLELSDKCLEFEFGDNALGHGLRQLALNPDKLLPCFKALAPKVPNCMLETWPIPIVGSWLMKAACMVGEATGLMDELLALEMTLWNKCLPDDSTPKGMYSCEAIGCLYEGSLLVRSSMFGFPVSDAMERVASYGFQKKYRSKALNRYKRYLGECINAWGGWTSNIFAPKPSLQHGPYNASNSEPEPKPSPQPRPLPHPKPSLQQLNPIVLILLAALLLGAFTIVVLLQKRGRIPQTAAVAVEMTKLFGSSHEDYRTN